jgi:Arc/MetJ family transcription regulator
MNYIYNEGNMKTLIDIQDDLMNELLKAADTTVKKDAIVLAIKTFLDVRRRQKLASLIGNYKFGYSTKELEEMRQDG